MLAIRMLNVFGIFLFYTSFKVYDDIQSLSWLLILEIHRNLMDCMRWLFEIKLDRRLVVALTEIASAVCNYSWSISDVKFNEAFKNILSLSFFIYIFNINSPVNISCDITIKSLTMAFGEFVLSKKKYINGTSSL